MQIRRHFTHGVILPRLGPGKSEPRQLTLSGVSASVRRLFAHHTEDRSPALGAHASTFSTGDLPQQPALKTSLFLRIIALAHAQKHN